MGFLEEYEFGGVGGEKGEELMKFGAFLWGSRASCTMG